jgi:hypothetical protein
MGGHQPNGAAPHGAAPHGAEPAGAEHPHERSWWQTAQSIGEDYIMPGFHAAEKMFPSVEHAVEHVVPLLGTYMGLADAGLNIYQAANSEGSERWDHIGGAILGAIGAIPAVGSYTGAAELGWNVGVGGAASITEGGVGAGMHAAHQQGAFANQMVGKGAHAVANGASALWDGATGMASDAYNWMDRGVRGIYGAPF